MFDFFSKSKRLRVRVAALIENEAGEILLIKQKKKNKDYWLLPGGGIEFGESAESSLKRELQEELSLELQSSEFLLLNESIDPNGNRHIIQIVFRVKLKSHEPKIPKTEKAVIEFGFFSREQIFDLEIRPNIKDFFKSEETVKFIKSDWVNE
jgi:8-oxo-dGTP diphosphatase